MFIILLAQFNSFKCAFIIISAIFLSTTGVLLGLLITGKTFVIVMCGLGIIALAGIVVNNNILLIDSYRSYMNLGYKHSLSVRYAAITRLRPILLTVGTTVLGLLPMMFGVSIDFF